ncbi:acyltransferase [Marinobacter sp. F4218]|uniref:acyltransferase n=1 Tax=Marinobacter sp. F4218 TaxID=2862868 RepID=UPI001C62E5AB|nr:acyltransferase [Marinobacter sp. F4218]MBW7470448.1 acyltransferase [Marinobacter sp. F4218]
MLKKFLNLYKRLIWSPEKLARQQGVKIGLKCDIHRVSFGSEPYLVTIGNHVQLTAGTKIFTHGAGWVLRESYPDLDFFGKVIIKDNVYIGNNCLIMPGVTIGSNVVIAAGSVVTKSVPDDVVVGGNPAKVIDSIYNFEKKMVGKNVRSKFMNPKEKREYLLSLPDESFIQK